MAHPIRGLHLSRRTVLRGAGVALPLPWLNAHVPALCREPDRPIRSLFIYAPNGKKMDDWKPAEAGRDYRLPFLLEPLRPHREDLTVFTGLNIDAGRPHGDGPGDHARAVSTYLTCAHPKKTGGADIHVGVSIDQELARAVGRHTTFGSLELGMEGGRSAGVCDSGYSCAYSNNVSWRTPTTPITKETDPRAVFTRLFGDPDAARGHRDRARDLRRLRSVLDAALHDVKSVRTTLGAADRRKLDEYLDAVREVEQRLQRQEHEEEDAQRQAPVELLDQQDRTFPAQLDLMYRMLAIALQTDRTRVATFMLGNGGSNRSYRFLNVPEGHHTLSHHRSDPAKLAGIRKINRFHTERFAKFLTELKQTPDGDTNLLHNVAIVYGSGLGDGNRHNHHDVPILLAGGGGGRLRTGTHRVYPDGMPLASLYLSLLHLNGVQTESFADSAGPIPSLLS